MNKTSDQKFKEFLREEMNENPQLVKMATKMVENKSLTLNDDALQSVSNLHNITKEQAKELWSKLISFNEILKNKYGDRYLENAFEICDLTQKYKQKLVEQYKTKNK